MTPPARASASRSLRIVTAETPKWVASSRTVARSRASISSLIRERRSSRKSGGLGRRAPPCFTGGSPACFRLISYSCAYFSSYSRLRSRRLSRKARLSGGVLNDVDQDLRPGTANGTDDEASSAIDAWLARLAAVTAFAPLLEV